MRTSTKKAAVAAIGLALIAPTPGTAIVAIAPIVVGPPAFMTSCRMSITQPGGSGPGAAIPFRILMLGAPVKRTTTSFTTGGGGTSNAAIAAQRKAAGLPYVPETINPESTAPPAIFAQDRGQATTWLPYQRLPLTPSKRIAEPFGLVFAQATSPSRGRIAALTLSLARRPTAPPRLRVAISGPPERGCGRQVVQIYARATSAAVMRRLVTGAANGCSWNDLTACTRAQWPRGRVLFVSPSFGPAFEYRWIDYDMLGSWRFGEAGRPKA